jgi:hypothetical protein
LFRNRLSGYLEAKHYPDYRDIAKYLQQEAGLIVVSMWVEKSNYAYFDFPKFFTETKIEFVLDSITLIWQFLKGKYTIERTSRAPMADAWHEFVARAFRHDNISYSLDELCGVHYFVDEEFERNRVSVLRAAGAPRSGRVELLLALASGDRLHLSQLSQLSGGAIPWRKKPLLIRVDGVVKPRKAPTFRVPAAAHHRKRLRATLDCLLDPNRTKEEKDELTRQIADEASRNNLIRRRWSDSGHVDQIISRNINGALAYALWLIADGSLRFRAALCRCEFSQCGRYFLEQRPLSGPGAPRRKHCTLAHGRMADIEKAKARMQERRDREKRR